MSEKQNGTNKRGTCRCSNTETPTFNNISLKYRSVDNLDNISERSLGSSNRFESIPLCSPGSFVPGGAYFTSSENESDARIGNYLLEEKLGDGTYGSVYSAMHIRTHEQFAIKRVSLGDVSQHSEALSQLKREATVMQGLNHPHIVHLVKLIIGLDAYYIVMEIVNGGELYNCVRKHGKLTEYTARKYFQQLISAVYYCHKHCVSHRDLKAENCLLTNTNQLKVCDFGLSRLHMLNNEHIKLSNGRLKQEKDSGYNTENEFSDAVDLVETSDEEHERSLGDVVGHDSYDISNAAEVGTVLYMPPEMLNGSTNRFDLSRTHDLWSCGCILYFMLVGKFPFAGRDEEETVHNIVVGNVNWELVNSGARPLIKGILARDPDERFTMRDIIEDEWFQQNIDPGLFPEIPLRETRVQRPFLSFSHRSTRENKCDLSCSSSRFAITATAVGSTAMRLNPGKFSFLTSTSKPLNERGSAHPPTGCTGLPSQEYVSQSSQMEVTDDEEEAIRRVYSGICRDGIPLHGFSVDELRDVMIRLLRGHPVPHGDAETVFSLFIKSSLSVGRHTCALERLLHRTRRVSAPPRAEDNLSASISQSKHKESYHTSLRRDISPFPDEDNSTKLLNETGARRLSESDSTSLYTATGRLSMSKGSRKSIVHTSSTTNLESAAESRPDENPEHSRRIDWGAFRAAWVAQPLEDILSPSIASYFNLPALAALVPLAPVKSSVVQELRRIFNCIDSDHDGLVDVQDIENFTVAVRPEPDTSMIMTNKEIAQLVYLIRGEGEEVSFEDFLVSVAKFHLLSKHLVGCKLMQYLNVSADTARFLRCEAARHGFCVRDTNRMELLEKLCGSARLVSSPKSPTSTISHAVEWGKSNENFRSLQLTFEIHVPMSEYMSKSTTPSTGAGEKGEDWEYCSAKLDEGAEFTKGLHQKAISNESSFGSQTSTDSGGAISVNTATFKNSLPYSWKTTKVYGEPSSQQCVGKRRTNSPFRNAICEFDIVVVPCVPNFYNVRIILVNGDIPIFMSACEHIYLALQKEHYKALESILPKTDYELI